MESTESGETSGVSLRVLTGAAVFASLIGRGIAPAIPGLAVGIAQFIALSGRASAFLSQLVAAGGTAAAIRLLGNALRLTKLDLGYRLIALPGSAIVVALVAAAWRTPLDPELCRIMALAAIGAALASAVASIRLNETRAAGLVLGVASVSGFAHLMARMMMSKAAERLDSSSLKWAVVVATLATLLDVVALALTLLHLGDGQRRKIALVSAAILLPALLVGVFAAHGSAPGAGWLRVLAERSLSQLSRAPTPALPSAIRFALSCAFLITAGACVLRRNRSKAAVVISLSLLSLGAADMPLPALWLVVAALLSPKLSEPAPVSDQRVVGRST